MYCTETEVIIIGGGPVGLIIALELDRQGINCLLVNNQLQTAVHPKANAINSRSMEHFRRHGIASKIRSSGLPSDYPTDVTYVTRLTGYELARLSMPSSSEAVKQAKHSNSIYDCSEPPHRCSQIYLEKILYDEVLNRKRIDVRFGHEFEEFNEINGGVTAKIRDLSTNTKYNVSAKYLIGADGGRSKVRRQLGIEYEGEGGVLRRMMGGAMQATYFYAERNDQWLKLKESWQYWIITSDLRALLMSVDGRNKFVLLTRIPDSNKANTIDDKDLISRAAGVPVKSKILLRQQWTAGHALIATSYGSNKVWLAGDSAHLFTPTGGLGMNTGIDDGVNLAWKLAAVINGWGGPNLLQSYEKDRRPIGIRNLSFATEFAESIGSFGVSSKIEEDSEAGKVERDKLGYHLINHGQREFLIPGIVLGARYDNSSIIWQDKSLPVPDEPYSYISTARPGSRAPHVWLKDGSAICDHFGKGFTLLKFNSVKSIDRLFFAANKSGVPIKLFDCNENNLKSHYGADLTLVGPDGHVVWRGNKIPNECNSLIDRIRGV